MDLGLQGKKALITAASQGIGNFIANTLAAEGADVAICARTADRVASAVEGLKAHGTNVCGAACDVGDGDALKAWVEASAAELGGIDIFVSNASAGGGGTLWNEHFAIDMMGTVNGVDAAVPFLTDSESPSVVIISTSAAVEAFPPPPATSAGAYGAMKAALLNYSAFAAQQHAAAGIRFNVVSPGPTDTPLLKEEIEQNPELIQRMTRLIPFRRVARPEDQAAAVSFLVSDDASYITGQVISVSGGLTMVD